jgi:hypothetical protein
MRAQRLLYEEENDAVIVGMDVAQGAETAGQLIIVVCLGQTVQTGNTTHLPRGNGEEASRVLTGEGDDGGTGRSGARRIICLESVGEVEKGPH